jgi:hypothetical protein
MSDKGIYVLNEVINNLTFFMPFVTMMIGTLGGLFNIIIFTSKELRYNSCGFYFLCSTVFDIVYLLLSGLTRFLIDDFSPIKIDRSILFCKCRTYLVVVIPILSTCFIMIATIDRCLSTSTSKKWRHLSQTNVAWRISIVSIILSFVFHCHILFFYGLQSNNVNKNVYKCVPLNDIYRMFINIYLFSILPFLLYGIMFVCSIITLFRIRKLRYRLGFINRRTNKYRIINRHLITIMFVQVGLGMLLTFFRCGYLIYTYGTNNITKSHHRITIELYFDKFSLIIYYMNFAKSFPVNSLTSPLFRRIFQKRIIYFLNKICPFVKGMYKRSS